LSPVVLQLIPISLVAGTGTYLPLISPFPSIQVGRVAQWV
jgi:hypothetical protein